MSWHGDRFFDPEEPEELNEDPYRCSWCRRPFDASRMNEHTTPEWLLTEAIARLRACGYPLEDAVRYVERIWQQENH